MTIRFGVSAAVGFVATLVFSSQSEAGTFGAPVALSTNGHAATVSVAMDDSGNAHAAWADEGMWTSDKPAGGAWSAPQSVYVGGAFPVMHMTGSGAATIVSYSTGSGIWSVDRPAGGAWTSPYLIVSAPEIANSPLVNVSPVQFLQNPNGDQAIVFAQSVGGNYVITAVRRPNGGTWSAQDNVASSANYGAIALDSAALGADGDLVVTFEGYTVTCTKYCHDNNYIVHASREKSGTTTWQDSGALTSPSTPFATETVIDSAGHAGLLIQNDYSATIQSTTQAKAGATWKPLVTAFQGTGSDGAYMWAAEAGNNAHASLAWIYLGTSGAGATILDGSTAKNTWSAPVLLSGKDSPGANDNMVFDENLAGGAVAGWTDIDGTVRASLRNKTGAAWSVAQTIVTGSSCNIGGVVCTGAVGGAVNPKGHAIVAYIRYDANVTVATLYVSTE
jgi:hypothetical protein